ncbi:hypothetical protein ABPG75_013846 [Micractinium tetrahymenae]
MRVILLWVLLLGGSSALAARSPNRSFADRLSAGLSRGGGGHLKAAAEAMSLALRMQGAQAHAVSSALASAFAAGGASAATAAAALADVLARGHNSGAGAAALEGAFSTAVLAVLPHNQTAAGAALAEGLSSRVDSLESGALRALRAVRQDAGCPGLLALLQAAREEAAALPSPADVQRFELHAGACAAACAE